MPPIRNRICQLRDSINALQPAHQAQQLFTRPPGQRPNSGDDKKRSLVAFGWIDGLSPRE